MEKLNNAQKTARKMVGDGKLPNKYWVTTSNYWLENTAEETSSFDGATYPESKFVYETFGPFDTYAEASKRMEELAQGCSEPYSKDRNNDLSSVAMEDRLSGTIYDGAYWVRHTKRGPWPTVEIEWQWSDETAYTRGKLGTDFK